MSAECIWAPSHCPDWPEHDCCGCGERGRKTQDSIVFDAAPPRFEQPIDPIKVTPEAIPWIKAGLIPRREVTVEELRKRYSR